MDIEIGKIDICENQRTEFIEVHVLLSRHIDGQPDGADLLVTLDKKDYKISELREAAILKAREFIQRMATSFTD